jgi:hypothetical protein
MQFLHDIERNSMIIGKVLGCDQRNGQDLTFWYTGAHISLMVKIGHGSIDQYKSCYNPSGVHENSFADADLSTHIVAKFFMDVN